MSSQTEEDCKETVGTLQGALSRAMTTLSRKLDQLTILQKNTNARPSLRQEEKEGMFSAPTAKFTLKCAGHPLST